MRCSAGGEAAGAAPAARAVRASRLPWRRLAGAWLLCWVGSLFGATPEVWKKVTSPHFTILTPADEATARAWAGELEQFRRGLQAIVPVPAEKLRPVTVVLFKTTRAMEPYLPLENGRPARLGGYFVRADEINTMTLSLDAGKEETRHTIFHEAVHWHLSAFEGPMPLCLGEGLAELYATFELTDAKTYTFGRPINSYVAMLRREPFMPLVRLFGTGRESLLYNEGTRASIFYAQAWALVHYMFYGEGSPGRDAILRYLTLLPTARSADEAFETAFGASYGAVEKRLREYIQRGSYRMHRYPRSTDDIARLLQASQVAPGDLELAQGSLLLGANQPELAEAHLRKAVALAPRDPRAWELLGHIAMGRKDYAAAMEVLAKAAESGSTNYVVYHNLGICHFPPPEVPGLAFTAHDPVEMDKAAANYRVAIRLAPAKVGGYEGLAGLMHGMQTFEPADLELLARGARLDPDNTTIQTGIAAGEIRAGRAEEGKARLRRLLAGKEESADRGLGFARKVLATETIKTEMEEVDARVRRGAFGEALGIVERALARELEPAHRQALETTQRNLTHHRAVAAAVEQANRGETEAAKQALTELIALEPERSIKADAARLLREIEKHEAKARERAGERRR